MNKNRNILNNLFFIINIFVCYFILIVETVSKGIKSREVNEEQP